MVLGSGRFQRSDRLLRSRDYQRVGREGKRFASGDFVVLVARVPPAAPGRFRTAPGEPETVRRLGVTVSRKVGNAVVRNRIKRAVREWFRLYRSALPEETDVVVIARRGAAELEAGEIGHRLCELLKALGAPKQAGAKA